MKKTKKAIASLAIAGMVLTSIPFNALAESVVPPRLGGYTAEQTAVLIAEQTGWTGTVVLASSASYGMVDALTASPLATYLQAPILLTEAKNVLNADTKAELIKLKAKTVYVTSGTAVISQAVLDELKGMGIAVIPLGGTDRFHTSVNIAKKMIELGAPVSKAAVAFGWLNQDALSIASIASAQNQPILLTEKDSIPASVKAFLAENPNVKSTDVIGGTGVISEAVKAQLPNPTRLFGSTAYDTNLAVLKAFDSFLKYDNVFIANGITGIDALTGAPLAAKYKAGIVLTSGTANEGTDYAKSKMTSASIVTALGGTAVVPEVVRSGAVSVTPPTPPIGGGGTPDTTAPVIALIGSSTVNVVNGAAYVDAGASVTDNVNTGLIATVTYTKNGNPVGSIDTFAAGTYVVRYNVSDTASNAAVQVTRTVIVAPKLVNDVTGLTNALADARITHIEFTGNITQPLTTVGRSVSIDFGAYVLTGNLLFAHALTGTSTLSGTALKSITGSLTVDTPNASFVNNVVVNGAINVINIVPGTWTETADGNIITITDEDGATITIVGNPGDITVSEDASGDLSINVNPGATVASITSNARADITVGAGANVTDIIIGAGAGGSTIVNNGTAQNMTVLAGANNTTITNSGTTGTVTSDAPITLQVTGGTTGTVTANANMTLNVTAGASVTDVNVAAGGTGSTITNNGTTGTVTSNAPMTLNATGGTTGTVTANAPMALQVATGAAVTNVNVAAGGTGSTITNNGTTGTVTSNAPMTLNATGGTTGTVTANAPMALQVATGAAVTNVNVAAGGTGSTITNNGTTGTVTSNAAITLNVAGGTTSSVTANAPMTLNVTGGTTNTVTANAQMTLQVAAGAAVTDINVGADGDGTTITNSGTTGNVTVEAGAAGTAITITNTGTATNVTTNEPITLVNNNIITSATTGIGGNIDPAGSTVAYIVISLTDLITAVNGAVANNDVIVALQALAANSPLDVATIVSDNAVAYVADFAVNPTTTVAQIRARVDAVNAAKIALLAAIAEAEAKVEANYTTESWSTMQNTLTAANACKTSSSTAIQVLAATNNLKSAITALVSKTVLITAIDTATTLVGSKIVGAAVGNVAQAAVDAFQATINAATVVKNSPIATQAQVDAQVAALAIATTNFNMAIITEVATIYTALNTAVSNATTLIGSKTVGTAIGNVSQATLDAFQAAIVAATAVKDDANATQAQVDAQVTALASATINFNNAIIKVAPVSKTTLNTAIVNATALIASKSVGTATGQVSITAKKTFQAAIDSAAIVNNNASATQPQVNAQVAALATATTNFNNAIIKGFDNLVDKIMEVYGGLSDTDKDSLLLAKTALQGFNVADPKWDAIINPLLTAQVIALFGDSATAKSALIGYMKDFGTLQYSTDRFTLESNIDTFKNNNLATFRTLFGNDFTMDQFSRFLIAVQEALPGVINSSGVSLIDLSDNTSTEIKDQLVAWTKAAAHVVADPTTDNPYNLFATKLSDLGLTMDKVVDAQRLLGEEIDPDNAAEKAITRAAIRSQIICTIPATMTIGQITEFKISVTGINSGAIELVNLLDWYSDDPSVIITTISGRRAIHAVQAGSAIITAHKSGGTPGTSNELVRITVTVPAN
ncbi:cell wall-binding repeat-containing protein [Desulfosporosinus sp. BICA1-9]|uniref:cell wall-binding repeat-containing protein n=1 Tax=Desulfosporosinus sp. BICA1-9 TaxID=1531958 RepID=UPI000A613E78|nr:cell wall-binding repeat-containing protein [Desulfosporosinus sp. BICA1-9]